MSEPKKDLWSPPGNTLFPKNERRAAGDWEGVKTWADAKSKLFDAVVLVVLFAANSVAYAIILSKFWLWFIVPVTHLAPLRPLSAYGLATTVAFVTNARIKEEDVDYKVKRPVRLALLRSTAYAILLGIGYLIHWFGG